MRTATVGWVSLLLWVGLAAVQQLAADGHPLLGVLAVIVGGLGMLGWVLLGWVRRLRAGRRGHPDEEAAVRAARLHLGVRKGTR